MFNYSSVQKRSYYINGKGVTKINSVTIKNNKGKKEVKLLNKSGRVTKKKSKSLTKKELYCIKKCRFVPGLFSDCEACVKPFLNK
jgi:hypothetical protein